MNTTSEQVAQAPVEAAEEICWRAWCTLGVSGVARPYESLAIDPEGLIVLSATVVTDRRLQDELIDWCSQFARYVSLSRLKRAVGRLSEAHATHVRELTERIGRVAPGAWPSNEDQQPAKTPLSGKSRLPRLNQPALTHLHHRAVFGTTSRSEVLIYLRRFNGPLSAAEVARGVGYGKVAVSRTLDELVEGHVLSVSMQGNRKEYTLRREKTLEGLVGTLPGEFLDWIWWSRLLWEIPKQVGKSERLLTIAVAKLLADIGPGTVGGEPESIFEALARLNDRR